MALIELGKSLLVEFEILGSGIQNTAQGFRNAANDWNREYQVPLTKNAESIAVESRIQTIQDSFT